MVSTKRPTMLKGTETAYATVRLVAISCALLLLYPNLLPADIVSRSVDKNVEGSSLIVIARLVHFTPNADSQMSSGTGSSRSHTQIILPDRPSGFNTIAVEARLKGTCPDSLDFQTEGIHFANYAAKVDLREGQSYLIFLNRAGENWAPTDAARPLVPLGASAAVAAFTPSTRPSGVTDSVVRLLLLSLNDEAVRASSFQILSATRGDAVAGAARLYMDDVNLVVRRNALKCLATNQVVEAIPRIADLARKNLAGGAIDALAEYDVPEAIPYFNVLLAPTEPEVVRYRAMLAVRAHKLSDKSSIPYLIQALHDPEPRGMVANFAYQALHEVVPTLGPFKDRAYFAAHRVEETQILEEWWANYQRSIVRRGNSSTEVPSSQPQ